MSVLSILQKPAEISYAITCLLQAAVGGFLVESWQERHPFAKLLTVVVIAVTKFLMVTLLYHESHMFQVFEINCM